jgi:hypothetical protein
MPELAECSVEEVAEGGGVAVAVCSALVVEIFGGARSGNGGEGPDEAHGSKPVVFHLSSADRDAASGGAGDWCGAGEGL